MLSILQIRNMRSCQILSFCVAGLAASVFAHTNSSESLSLETLRGVHVIFRHGSRSPLSSYADDPYNNTKYWPSGLGQLTPNGKQQCYEFGRYLRSRYQNFISPSFNNSEVYGLSSDFDRTIMSLELVLLGLYSRSEEEVPWNQTSWEPIPFHIIPRAVDNKIALNASCPRYVQLELDYKRAQELTENKINDYMYKYLSENTKTNVTDLKGVLDLYDVLFIQELHNLTLPTWASRYYPDRMRQASEEAWLRMAPTNETRRLHGGPLLGDIVLKMEKVVSGSGRSLTQPSAKMFLYSGHDSTLVSFLQILDIFDRQIIPYTASVIMELHQKSLDVSSSEYYVRIFLRNDTNKPPQELAVPNCRSPCTYLQFRSLYNDVMILDESIWEYECKSASYATWEAIKSTFSGLGSKNPSLLVAAGVLAVLVLLFLFVHVVSKSRKNATPGSHTCTDESGGQRQAIASESQIRHSLTNSNFKLNENGVA